MEEVDDFDQRLLRLVLTGHILEGDTGLLLHIHLRGRLADTHDAAVSVSHAAHGHIHDDEDQNEREDDADEGLHDKSGIVRFLLIDDDAMLEHTVHELLGVCTDRHDIVADIHLIQVRAVLSGAVRRHRRTLLRDDRDITVAPLHLLDLITVDHRDKLGIADLLRHARDKHATNQCIYEKGDDSGDDQNHKSLPRMPEASAVVPLVVIILHLFSISFTRRNPVHRMASCIFAVNIIIRKATCKIKIPCMFHSQNIKRGPEGPLSPFIVRSRE